ncbi:hypothetical protein FGO68_gene6478 [Halteria grandinella]|uniref:CHAT domain-containing protein n=1 Tax=Halteria grandinella TaxID=5974 RepID=A0A8J8P677_HALGN|nr:hypothetical protein FGO68_gene6478 [Halteria grandinella]
MSRQVVDASPENVVPQQIKITIPGKVVQTQSHLCTTSLSSKEIMRQVLKQFKVKGLEKVQFKGEKMNDVNFDAEMQNSVAQDISWRLDQTQSTTIVEDELYANQAKIIIFSQDYIKNKTEESTSYDQTLLDAIIKILAVNGSALDLTDAEVKTLVSLQDKPLLTTRVMHHQVRFSSPQPIKEESKGEPITKFEIKVDQTNSSGGNHQLAHQMSLQSNTSAILIRDGSLALVDSKSINGETVKELSFYIKREMKSIWKKRTERVDHGLKVVYPGCQEILKKDKQQALGNKNSIYQICDLLFLFSLPLVEKEKDKDALKPNEQQVLEIEKEYRLIKRMIEEQNIDFLMAKKPATEKTLLEAFQKKPKIVHISCHGQRKNEKNAANLRLEDDNQIALEVQFNKQNIEKICDSISNNNEGIQLLFINACHSQEVAEYFQEKLHVPVVIAINNQDAIADDAAIEFSRQFYSYLILGYTPKEAHRIAMNFVHADKYMDKSTCADHAHEPWCEYQKTLDRHHGISNLTVQNPEYLTKFKALTVPPSCICNNSDNVHQPHCPSKNFSCYCPERYKNSHQAECTFYKRFKQEFLDKKQIGNMEHLIKEPETRARLRSKWTHEHLCCCKPGTDHGEAKKFIILGKGVEEKLFEEVYSGKVYDNSNSSLRQNLIKIDPKNPSNIQVRNLHIQEIAQFFRTHPWTVKQEEDLILHFYGPEGIGKEDIVAQAVHQAFTRDHLRYAFMFHFNHGSVEQCLKVIYTELNKQLNLKIQNKLTTESIVEGINKQDSLRNLFTIVIVLNKPEKVCKTEHQKELISQLITQLHNKVDKEIGLKIAIIEDANSNNDSQLLNVLDKTTRKAMYLPDSEQSEKEFYQIANALMQPTLKWIPDDKLPQQQKSNEYLMHQFFKNIYEKLKENSTINRSHCQRFFAKLKKELFRDNQNALKFKTSFEKRREYTNCMLKLQIKQSKVIRKGEMIPEVQAAIDATFKSQTPPINQTSEESKCNSSPEVNKLSEGASSRDFTQSKVREVESQDTVCSKCREQIQDADDFDESFEVNFSPKKEKNIELHEILQKREEIFSKDGIISLIKTPSQKIVNILQFSKKRNQSMDYFITKCKIPLVEEVQFKKAFKFDQGWYQGFVKNNTQTPQGYGLYINKDDGSVYEGFRVNGLREGPGVYVENFNQEKEQISEYLESTLLIYEGNWDNNQPHSQGTMYFPNGDVYIGNFNEGNMNGKGMLYVNKEKCLYFGYFENGQKIESFKVLTQVYFNILCNSKLQLVFLTLFTFSDVSKDTETLQIMGNVYLQDYHFDILNASDGGINQPLNLILVPQFQTALKLGDIEDKKVSPLDQGKMISECIACPSIRPGFDGDGLRKLYISATDGLIEASMVAKPIMVEVNAHKLLRIVNNFQQGKSQNEISDILNFLQFISLSYDSSQFFLFSAVLGLDGACSPILAKQQLFEMEAIHKDLKQLVTNLKNDFFKCKSNNLLQYPQIKVPLKLKNWGARIDIDHQELEKQARILLTSIQQTIIEKPISYLKDELANIDIQIANSKELTQNEVQALIHSEFASVFVFNKNIHKNKESNLQLKMFAKSTINDKRIMLGKTFLDYYKIMQYIDLFTKIPEKDRGALADYQSMALDAPLAQSKIGKLIQIVDLSGESLRQKINHLKEIVCKIILQKVIYGDIEESHQLSQIFSTRDDTLLKSLNFMNLQMNNSFKDIEQVQKRLICDALAIQDVLQELKVCENQLEQYEKLYDENTLLYLIGTFIQHLGLDQTIQLLKKLEFNYFKIPGPTFQYNTEGFKIFQHFEYDSSQLKQIEETLGYQFDKEKPWLYLAFQQDSRNEALQKPMSDIGRAFIKLAICSFCDRAYPDNQLGMKVSDNLQELFQSEFMLIFLAKKLKLDDYISVDTINQDQLSSILNELSKNPTEFPLENEQAKFNGFGDRLNQFKSQSKIFMSAKSQLSIEKHATLILMAALLYDAKQEQRMEIMYSEFCQLIPFALALCSSDLDLKDISLFPLLQYTSLQSMIARSTTVNDRYAANPAKRPNGKRIKFSQIMLKYYEVAEEINEENTIEQMTIPDNMLINAKTYTVEQLEKDHNIAFNLRDDELINVKMDTSTDGSAQYVVHIIHSKALKYLFYIQETKRQERSLLQEFIFRANNDYHHLVVSRIDKGDQLLRSHSSLSQAKNEVDDGKIILAQKLDLVMTMKSKNEVLIEQSIDQKAKIAERRDELLAMAKNKAEAINFIKQFVNGGDQSNSNVIKNFKSGTEWISYKIGSMNIKQPRLDKSEITGNESQSQLSAKFEIKIKTQIYQQQLFQIFDIIDFPNKILQDWIEIIVLQKNQCTVSDYLMLRMDTPNFKTLFYSLKPDLTKDAQLKKVHDIIRIMLQTVFYIADLNQNKGLFHGNDKLDRIHMSPDGLRGFIDQGTFVSFQSPDDRHEVSVCNQTNGKIEFKQRQKKSKFFTKDDLLKEDWYELFRVCCEEIKYDLEQHPHLQETFSKVGGREIQEIVKNDQYQLAFYKAQLISVNAGLCLKIIASLRQYNTPYYSYNFWRFFEGCIKPELFIQTKLLAVIKGNFDRNIRQMERNQGELDDIEELFMQDHWWTLIQDDSTSLQTTGEALQIEKHPWLEVASKLKQLILQAPQSSFAPLEQQEHQEESKEQTAVVDINIIEVINSYAKTLEGLEEELAKKIKTSLLNAFTYPAHFIREEIRDEIRSLKDIDFSAKEQRIKEITDNYNLALETITKAFN